MFHQEIYAGVGRLLSLREDAGRYCLLDLGCGNARYLALYLRQSPPALYEGVDLSEAALIEACGYLADLPGSTVTLTHGDLLEAVKAHRQNLGCDFHPDLRCIIYRLMIKRDSSKPLGVAWRKMAG